MTAHSRTYILPIRVYYQEINHFSGAGLGNGHGQFCTALQRAFFVEIEDTGTLTDE
jgi:hypothetical protein